MVLFVSKLLNTHEHFGKIPDPKATFIAAFIFTDLDLSGCCDRMSVQTQDHMEKKSIGLKIFFSISCHLTASPIYLSLSLLDNSSISGKSCC